MDNNEAFFKEIKEIGIGLCSNCSVSTWRIEELWQAAQQQSAGEIAELESELNDMTQVAMKLEPLIYEADALKADNERLREALEVCKWDCNTGEVIQIAAEALAKTPEQCLIEHDNEVIERCAKVIEPDAEHRKDASWGYIGGEEGVELLDNAAEKIRKLKGTP